LACSRTKKTCPERAEASRRMKEFIKGKIVTVLVVGATVMLAGVAIFTALRLYQLRRESVSLTQPESEPLAWDCQSYNFILDQNGKVSVENNSSRDEPSQQAKVFINNNLVATFNVPALTKGQSAEIGTVNIPNEATINWKIEATKDCSDSGSFSGQKTSCELLTFTISIPSLTPTVTPTITPTRTPTPTPTGTLSITPTQSPTPTPTQPGNSPTSTHPPTPTSVNQTSTPTPSKTAIAATSPAPSGAALPDAGVGAPTVAIGLLGIILIVGAILLAI